MIPDELSINHQFNECSLSDQETIRRKMRSSSHSAGFRPVVPAKVEVDELERHVASMKIEDEEVSDTTQLNYLVWYVCYVSWFDHILKLIVLPS